MIKTLLSGTAVLVFAGLASAQEFHAGTLSIEHPYALATAPTARAGAGYMTIENAGTTADRLLAVRADFPEVSLHRSEIDSSGVARMLPVEAVEIPAGQTVTLEPKGIHVMFMGLSGPLKADASFPATLVFEQTGEVPVEFHVMARGAAMDHDMHNMGN